MKITKTTYELTPEESAVLLCELSHENTTAPTRTIADMVKEMEFIRKARECGRVNF